MTDSNPLETNLFIVTTKDRCALFCKLYWRTFVIFIAPLILMPIAFISTTKAYRCLFVFLLTTTYWITDAMHPSIAALVPIALSSVMGATGHNFMNEMYIRNELLDCFGVMMIIITIEQSLFHKRVALKLLLVFGCSHYRLSFFLFFTCMFLSMWFSSILVCGLMMPLVKAILEELERIGILEIYETVGKEKQMSNRHGESHPRPTNFTLFYFLGIAYSSTIGAMTTLMSSQTNQIFKIYSEKIFPSGPKIEFPNMMLLNLPGVIVMETLLYFWMNFYFIGMFRRNASLEIGMSEEETQYVKTLFAAQFKQLRKISFYEVIVLFVILLTALLQVTLSTANIDGQDFKHFHNHFRISSPCILSALLLFILPVNLDFLTFFKRHSAIRPLLQVPSKTCLSWPIIRDNLHWSVIFIIGGSSVLFQSLQDSELTEELERALCAVRAWPASGQLLAVVLLCKLLTELAPAACVAYCLLPHIARMSIICNVNPHYMMLGATMAISQSYLLSTGAPVNAMVAAYVHIPPWKMMLGGIVPSVVGVGSAWFTASAWCAAVWAEATRSPAWASHSVFNMTELINKNK